MALIRCPVCKAENAAGAGVPPLQGRPVDAVRAGGAAGVDAGGGATTAGGGTNRRGQFLAELADWLRSDAESLRLFALTRLMRRDFAGAWAGYHGSGGIGTIQGRPGESASMAAACRARLVDAKSLLDGHRWSAAYYVAGYAVECGLKACVLARLTAVPEVIFDNKRFSESCWTHSILELVKLAGLEPTGLADMTANRALRENWQVVKDWSEKARYNPNSDCAAKKRTPR